MCNYNTDMADERIDEYKTVKNLSSIDGIEVKQTTYDEFKITEVNVLNENGKNAIQKDIGKYITIDTEEIKYLDDENLLIEKIKVELEKLIPMDNSIFVVGLGNMYVTADALGAKVIKGIEATRHILKLGKMYNSNTREVSCISPGVMGNTGIETSEIVYAVANTIKPKTIVVIDSLMSKSISRVGKSIQISDTGIIPGSGITGVNKSIDSKSMNAKVISIGVPMVVDVATIANEAIEKIEDKRDNSFERYTKIKNVLDTQNLIVTPKDIDELIEITSRIIYSSINKLI